MSLLTFNELEKKLKGVKIEGFIINQGNKRIFEYVKNKKVKDKPTKVYSVTKSVVSMLIGILMDRGLINSIHEPIYNYFPELRQSDESWKKEITIFHLLTMTSGLKVYNFQGSKNWVKCILEQPCLHKPGSIFQYNSGDSHLLSALVKMVSGMPTATFAEKNLFSPLGIQKYIWVSDPQGIHGGGFSISMKLEDMMKIGLLLLNKGNYSSNQLISSNWIDQSASTYKHVETAPSGVYGYGYQLWTFESLHKTQPIDYFCANGLFGQNIFVVPKLEMVAVTKSQLQNDNQSLPRHFFEEFLLSLDGVW